jgi:cytosine/adenosine deaminase-related metal-dependent hydrolase
MCGSLDGEKIIDANSVAVADGKIFAVGNDVAAPPNAQVIDGRGDTLLPGLIGSHVHLWTRDELRQALMFGVTTELDMFMRWQQAQQWKDEARTSADIADFRTAGTCITAPKGHGSDYGIAGTELAFMTGAPAFTAMSRYLQRVRRNQLRGREYERRGCCPTSRRSASSVCALRRSRVYSSIFLDPW